MTPDQKGAYASRCDGSGRGTALREFVIRNNAWLAPCSVCGLDVSIAIDGRAVVHAARRAAVAR